MRIAITTVTALTLALSACASATEEGIQEPAEVIAGEVEGGERRETAEEWDGERFVTEVETALDEEWDGDLRSFTGPLALVAEEPGHIRAVTTEDTILPDDTAMIVAEACDTVPELELVTVDHSQHGGEVIGPMEVPC